MKFSHIDCIIARLKLELARNTPAPKLCGNRFSFPCLCVSLVHSKLDVMLNDSFETLEVSIVQKGKHNQGSRSLGKTKIDCAEGSTEIIDRLKTKGNLITYKLLLHTPKRGPIVSVERTASETTSPKCHRILSSARLSPRFPRNQNLQNDNKWGLLTHLCKYTYTPSQIHHRHPSHG